MVDRPISPHQSFDPKNGIFVIMFLDEFEVEFNALLYGKAYLSL